MNKLIIITIALMALSQATFGGEKNALEMAQEVAQQMKTEADKEYAKGVAKRNELHQWPDAAEAVKRIQARYDQHELMRHKAQLAYNYYRDGLYTWCGGDCLDHKRAARHWQGFRDRTEPYVAVAESHIKTSGTTIGTEVARAKKHLEWAKMEKRWADSMDYIVNNQYRTGEYIDEALITVRAANAEVAWADKSVMNALDVAYRVSDEVLREARRIKYYEADTYLRRQRAVHEAEQAAIEREIELKLEREKAIREAEQAITDKENAFLQLMKDLLYGA
jgi:hypothetical protein